MVHQLTVEANRERRVARGLGAGTGCLAQGFCLVEPGAPPKSNRLVDARECSRGAIHESVLVGRTLTMGKLDESDASDNVLRR